MNTSYTTKEQLDLITNCKSGSELLETRSFLEKNNSFENSAFWAYNYQMNFFLEQNRF